MATPLPPGFSLEQDLLWRQVVQLWELATQKDAVRIRQALHPDYMGWDTRQPQPHDREAAVHSITGDANRIAEYELEPLSVRVYEGAVGVVHYAYQAMVHMEGGAPVQVAGKWSEVYARKGPHWLLVAVSGRPGEPDAG